jgi:hypothetical protein
MPTTNPFDRKLATVLKALNKGVKDASAREKVSKDFQSIRSWVADASFGQILDDLFKSFSAAPQQRVKPEQAQVVTVIRTLCDREFVSSAAFLFAGWRDQVASLPLDAVLPLVPDAAAFEAWRKASAQPAKDIEQRLLTDPTPTYLTAGADWLLLHVTPEKQLPLLDLFLSRKSRPKFLPSWAEAITLALKKNKKRGLLPFCLEHSWPSEDRLVTLAEVIRLDAGLMQDTVDVLPKILSAKEAPAGTMLFIRQLFADLIATTDGERLFATASLARLATGVLLANATSACANESLAFIKQTVLQLRGATRDSELQSQTWIFESLQEEKVPADGGLQITFDGARRFAVAYEKARQGLDAADLLSTTAKNLGLSIINSKGDQVPYNPLEHEDSQGGIRPSELVLVLETGLKYQNTVVLRALVGKVSSK